MSLEAEIKKKQKKPVENLENQHLIPGEKLKNQDSPGQIRRFGNPDLDANLEGGWMAG